MGHIRGLDGIRALSVLAIIAFHTGLNSVPGGFYGVDSFFVLSGFLITSLLVREWSGSGTIRLRRFWAGRARRLLPALFLLVAVIGIVLAVVPSVLATPHIVGDALSTMFYFSNWYSIHNGVTYFSLSTQPSPLLHTWSLAIEEQFYLVWPLVVLGVLKLGTTRRAPPRHTPRRPHRAASPSAVPSTCSAAASCSSSARPRCRTTRRGCAAAGCRSSSRSPAWARSPRPFSWPSWRRTATPPGPTTAPTRGPRPCWSAPPSPSG